MRLTDRAKIRRKKPNKDFTQKFPMTLTFDIESCFKVDPHPVLRGSMSCGKVWAILSQARVEIILQNYIKKNMLWPLPMTFSILFKDYLLITYFTQKYSLCEVWARYNQWERIHVHIYGLDKDHHRSSMTLT